MNEIEKRPLKPALWKGFSRKCPNCGEGRLFDGYLKVNDRCPSCNEDLTHQRTDDGPAWATMLVVGHMIPPLVMGIYEGFENPSPLVVALILIAVMTILTLLLLPRIKGVFVAIQWANRMHGFGTAAPKTEYEEPAQ